MLNVIWIYPVGQPIGTICCQLSIVVGTFQFSQKATCQGCSKYLALQPSGLQTHAGRGMRNDAGEGRMGQGWWNRASVVMRVNQNQKGVCNTGHLSPHHLLLPITSVRGKRDINWATLISMCKMGRKNWILLFLIVGEPLWETSVWKAVSKQTNGECSVHQATFPVEYCSARMECAG